ncbi:ROK family transcriptional regulator [Nesterenkonia sp. HG001]|uniref:ROK family transcriptional regulator n=1 Tax=Nesterenkonia sp. HG001 TaxID=2983207 RepID=UPI002AC4E9B8|nr:ROK family transcriptional regulator [Nesterenkonia sp. HG001]MDZ5076155.1 ROK family transcriptional regulator [Nesterenkonia sp. HG001]
MHVARSTNALGGTGASDLFQLLRDGVPKSRTELAGLTGLARSTVNDRLSALAQLGLIGPATAGASTGGRPPRRVALLPDARLALAVDLGASHVRLAVVNLLNAQLNTYEEPLDIASGPEAVLTQVMRRADELLVELSRSREDVMAVGIGLPGPVHFETGRPARPPIMPGWDGFDVPGWFHQHLAAPVLVDNDVNLMALGEHSRLARPVEHFLFVKVATGIGAGIISGGRLQRGAQGIAGDIGHVRVRSGDGVYCHCGNEGCLEAVASGSRLADRLRRAGRQDVLGGRDVVSLVDSGDLEAIRAVRQAGRDLGEVLAASISFLNPEVIAVGGRMAGAGEHLLAGVREVVYQRAMPLATQRLDIHTATQSRDAGLLGASLLALHHALSPEGIDALAEATPAETTPAETTPA